MNSVDVDRDALARLFFEESREGLNAMEEAAVALEEGRSDAEALNTMFRVAHTLKGNAASLGYEDLASVTHHLEDVLDRLRSGTLGVSREVVDVLLASVDVLRGQLEQAQS